MDDSVPIVPYPNHINMYPDELKLDRHKKTWITKEVYRIAWKEKQRLWREEKRKVTLQKLINNAVIEKYAKTP